MYDAIIVGARCAGSPTAMLLARAGHKVLLVDRASFPSDALSTHYIHQAGVARLHRWGLLDQVVASNCPPARKLTFDVGPFALVGALPPADGIAEAYAPRRFILDKVLVDAAVAAGVELRERFTVEGLAWEDGRVVGVRGRERGGSSVVERARIVVGADGVRSLVAKAVEAPAYDIKETLTCAYYSYWSGVPVNDGAELYPRPGRMIGFGPTNDGQTLGIVYWPHSRFHEVRADVEGHFSESLELVPALAERVRVGERTERFFGTADLLFFFRRPWGPGWALVGDAGYHKDPLTAEGITDAFRDAELLAEALDSGFAGRSPLDEALAAYERARNEDARPIYEFTYELAGLAPPPLEMQELFEALRDNPEQTSRFFGVMARSVPFAEFFAPENIAPIIGRELVAEPA